MADVLIIDGHPDPGSLCAALALSHAQGLRAGGASAGVLGPLIEARPAEIVVANRTADKAQVLVDRHADWARQHGVTLSARSLSEPGTAYDVFINGTAASLSGGGIPVGPEVLRPGGLALDMMYGPAAQPFLDWAQHHGALKTGGQHRLLGSEHSLPSGVAGSGLLPFPLSWRPYRSGADEQHSLHTRSFCQLA